MIRDQREQIKSGVPKIASAEKDNKVSEKKRIKKQNEKNNEKLKKTVKNK